MKTYRSEGNHLYKLKNGVYIHVYQNPRINTLTGLIAAYERQCEEEFLSGDSDAWTY